MSLAFAIRRLVALLKQSPQEPREFRHRKHCNPTEKLERVKGIEPSSSAWKAVALPLSYTRDQRSEIRYQQSEGSGTPNGLNAIPQCGAALLITDF
jgi:hypothetical protein